MNQHAQSVLGDFAAGANDKDTLRPDDWARFRRFVINALIRRQSMSTVEVSDHLTLLGFSQKQAWRLGRFYTRAEAILTAMDVHGCMDTGRVAPRSSWREVSVDSYLLRGTNGPCACFGSNGRLRASLTALTLKQMPS